MADVFECLNRNAAAIQAVGSVVAIFVAIGVAWWPTHVARRDQADTRRRAARVLAMELQPTVKTIQENLERAVQLEWIDLQYLNIHALQQLSIVGPDVLESSLDRLHVLDDETIRPIQRMLSALRAYDGARSQTDMMQLAEADLPRELAQRKSLLEDARRAAAEALKRLDKVAKV